jgi:hypothetical protein
MRIDDSLNLRATGAAICARLQDPSDSFHGAAVLFDGGDDLVEPNTEAGTDHRAVIDGACAGATGDDGKSCTPITECGVELFRGPASRNSDRFGPDKKCSNETIILE